MFKTTDTIIIGAGQAGLACSRYLSRMGIDHVVFERGDVGQRWRSERWQSLHLLTPNWMTRLPGFAYSGNDPDGFMHKDAVTQLTPKEYKSPDQLEAGGVLVVGASATGIQLAHEVLTSGRNVTLAAGRHTPAPRSYRGRDIMDWLDASGVLAMERRPDVALSSLLRLPSFQLVGRNDRADQNLATFQAAGGRIVGRVTDACAATMRMDPDFASIHAAAMTQQTNMLHAIDRHIDQNNLNAPAPPQPTATVAFKRPMPAQLNLAAEGIRTILWCTGYKRDYGWLRVPVLTSQGEIAQQGGVTAAPGLFTMGLPFMRRCNSSFIDGVARDAKDITQLIARHLDRPTCLAA